MKYLKFLTKPFLSVKQTHVPSNYKIINQSFDPIIITPTKLTSSMPRYPKLLKNTRTIGYKM
jgi:hypothetical protein